MASDEQRRRSAFALCEAADAFRDAVNQLWWAQNPDEREGIPPSEESATEIHGECFTALANAVARVRKDFDFKSKAAGDPSA